MRRRWGGGRWGAVFYLLNEVVYEVVYEVALLKKKEYGRRLSLREKNEAPKELYSVTNM